jgi:hypothetical protein
VSRLPITRWMRRCLRDPATGCLLWSGAVNDQGYAVTSRGYLHRVLYEHFIGPIPAGTELDHLCRTTYCVEPTHVEPVTHAVNMLRGWAARKGTP